VKILFALCDFIIHHTIKYNKKHDNIYYIHNLSSEYIICVKFVLHIFLHIYMHLGKSPCAAYTAA